MNLFDPEYKWWMVEIRFGRTLTEEELSLLRRRLNEIGVGDPPTGSWGVVEGEVSQGSLLIPQWPEKWPGAHADANLRSLVKGFPSPEVKRAPFGYGCEEDPCEPGEIPCTLGSAFSCLPRDPERWISL